MVPGLRKGRIEGIANTQIGGALRRLDVLVDQASI